MPTTLTHNEMHGMPRTAALMRWIDSHDRPELTTFDPLTGLLVVASVEMHGGVATVVREEIQPSHEAARALLGY